MLSAAIGSMGNGASMRVAPLGAWLADDLDAVTAEARASAEVTHSHPEGQAGAIAVAVAAAVAHRGRAEPVERVAAAIFEEVIRRTPIGETREKIIRASELAGVTSEEAARVLGRGFLITAPDTVPFVIWSAARHLAGYREAIVETATVGGDTDTNCAMVGGIVALFTGVEGIPEDWRSAREAFDLATLP